MCELSCIPACTLSGNCDVLYCSAVPGGPADRFADRLGPDEHLRRIRECCANTSRASTRAPTTSSRPTREVRSPAANRRWSAVPSGAGLGRVGLGMADVVVANDPITGQGSNNASKCAESYLHSILERADPVRPELDARHVRPELGARPHVTFFANSMLQPPPEHVRQIFGAAQTSPAVAKRFVNGFNDPSDPALVLRTRLSDEIPRVGDGMSMTGDLL